MSGTVLITGASGALGWHLCRFLQQRKFQVVGSYCRHRPGLPGVAFSHLDLRDPDEARTLAGSHSWKAVIHTAAMTHPDECEGKAEETQAVNVIGTQALMEGLAPGTPFLYISTDLVFNGLQGDYREEDEATPVNRYGESKREAEVLVRARAGGVVVRMCKIYAPASPFHETFESWLQLRFERGERLNLFQDQYRTPIYVGDVARALEGLLEKRPQYDLYHLGGPERVSRSRFGEIFAEVLGYDPAQIVPVMCEEHLEVPRGKDCSLNSSRLLEEYQMSFHRIRDGLKRMRAGLY